jgi:hypothetical protein
MISLCNVPFECSVTFSKRQSRIVNKYNICNKVRELATVSLPWQQWTETLVWFYDVGISSFHSYVVDIWQFLSEWCLLLSECVLVCHRENVGASIRATNEH